MSAPSVVLRNGRFSKGPLPWGLPVPSHCTAQSRVASAQASVPWQGLIGLILQKGFRTVMSLTEMICDSLSSEDLLAAGISTHHHQLTCAQFMLCMFVVTLVHSAG